MICRHLDVVVALAGAILGLLALHHATGDGAALDFACRCGQRLLRQRTTAPSGHPVWVALEGRLLIGFGHGAAGIAYALLRLVEPQTLPSALLWE